MWVMQGNQKAQEAMQVLPALRETIMKNSCSRRSNELQASEDEDKQGGLGRALVRKALTELHGPRET
jgi:hypothetical protein